jgi:O-antigen/teichoic acid export membrane protein
VAGAGGSDAIRGLAINGLAWKGASQAFLQGSRVVVAVVLARLLAPHDYGLAAMVLVFASLVLVFSDLALGAALVQRQRLSELDLATVFWTSIGAGLLFTLLGTASSGPVARFYGEPAVRGLVVVLSLGFVVAAIGTVPTALLNRAMAFRALEMRMMLATAAGAITGITLALAGFGAWAIIGQQLAFTVTQTVLVWVRSPWRPSLTFSFERLRVLAGFSANVFGQRLLYYLHRNTDNLLVGRFLGAAALGAYGLAYNIMLVPFSRIAGPIQEVLFPAFSRIQDDRPRMAAVWIRVTRAVAAVSMPSLLGLFVLAPEFVAVVLGPRWDAAVPVLRILVWVGLIQSLQTLNTSILIALDRTRALLRYSVFFFVAHLTAFAIGVHWGIVGVATGYAISTAVVEPLFARMTARALGISVFSWVRSIAGVAQASVVMLIVVVPARTLLVQEGVPAPVRLVGLALLGGGVFFAASAWRVPELKDELRQLRRRRTTDVAPAAAATGHT